MLYSNLSNSVASSASINSTMLKPDSGASAHFLKPAHVSCLYQVKLLTNGPTAILSNNTSISPSTQGLLPFKNLSKTATKALIYPSLMNESLLSIGQLCDDNCRAIFEKDKIFITK